MPDRDDATRDVLALLDRAAAHTTPLHLDRGAVVARGEQIVRRRRATVGGMSFGALALAVAVWLGVGGGGSLLGTPEISPASVTWQVEEPTTLTVLDGIERGGNVSPLTVTKDGDEVTATFTVDGHEETVAGTTMAGGADLFVGGRATVIVWEHPAGASPAVDVLPAPHADLESGPAQGDEGVHYLTTTDRGYVPQEIVFHTDSQVWTASGDLAQTAEVSDGRWSVQAFELPGTDFAGYLQGGQVNAMDVWTSAMSSYTEPWWRGGDAVNTQVFRLPTEAAWVRPVWVDGVPSEDEVGRATPTVQVGDSAFAVHSFTEDERSSEDIEIWGRYQWSADGTRWEEPRFETSEPPTSFDGIEFAVDEDGTATATRDGVQLRPLPTRHADVWSWADDEGAVGLMNQSMDELVVPVVQVGQQVRDAGSLLLEQQGVQVGGQEMTVGRLSEGASLVGTAALVPAGPDVPEPTAGGTEPFWSLLGGDPVPSYDLGGSGIHVAVDEELGVWAAHYQPEGQDADVYATVVGEVDGEGKVVFTDGGRNRVAVVSVLSGEVVETGDGSEAVRGRDARPVLKPGAVGVRDTVQSTGGISTTEGAWPGVAIRSTVVQCLKADETCVEGLDTTGDGAVDLAVHQEAVFAWAQDGAMEGTGVYGPGETLTVLGREQVVRDGSSGWPALAGAELTENGPHEISGRFPWAGGGTAYALVDVVLPDEVDLVAEGDGQWLEPAEVHVVQGRSGSVTVLVYPPGSAQTWGAAGVRGPDGEVAQLPLP